MGLRKKVSLRSLESFTGGTTQFYTPQSCHETMLVHIAPQTVEDLFVHHYQTDQLLVVRGSIVLVVLSNAKYEYLLLSEDNPQMVTIPPGVPHGAINSCDAPCVVVNAVMRHGQPCERDYRPLKPPFPYDLKYAQDLQNKCFHTLAA
jgi:mannose-6-phosphate isomerase-like protein (cupin superfamily)